VRRQARDVAAAASLEARALPADLDYARIAGLSAEAAQKLARLRPRDVAQASRIDGVRAADLSLLLVHLRRHETAESSVAVTAVESAIAVETVETVTAVTTTESCTPVAGADASPA